MAQNERTLFSFLMSMSGEEEVGLGALYRFFEPVMRADTAPGGTYRQWLETQSATAKVDSELQVSALQACSILSLGFSSEGSRVSRGTLEFAVSPTGKGAKSAVEAVQGLIDRKLLLHRVHSDVVSLWHGTDVDIRSRLNSAKDRFRAGFDVRQFLSTECAPPVWRPVRYNDEHWMRRYVEPEYQLASEFMAEATFSALLEEIPPGVDLKLIYLLAQNEEELDAARTLGKSLTKRKDMRRLVVAIPSGIADLSDACLEVWSLMQLAQDTELVGSDPFVLDELRQMEEDARGRLMLLADRVIQPNSGLDWFWNGKVATHQTARGLREWLSVVTEAIYPNTPCFRSEVINRKKPSPVVINARKKLTGSILELSGEPDLGFGDDRFSQEPSAAVEGIYRAVLVHSGLYGEGSKGRWGYAAPVSLKKDSGLKEVWRQLQVFFTKPAPQPKSFNDLITTLLLPPLGVRAGVVPILIAAASRAFPTAGALTRDGEYVDDLKPSDLEELCKEPQRFKLNVVALDEAQEAYLEGVYSVFSAGAKYTIDRTDLICACNEAIAVWKEHLPRASRSSRRVTAVASSVRERIFNQKDPIRLLLDDLPAVIVGDNPDYKKVLKGVRVAKSELEAVVDDYYSAVRRVLHQVTTGSSDPVENDVAQAAAREWCACFPAELIDQVPDTKAKALIARLLDTYRSEKKYVNAIATVIHGRKIEDWLDADLAQFEQSLRAAISGIEEAALHPTAELKLSPKAAMGIAAIVERRIERLLASMEHLVGADASKERLSALLGDQHANHG